MYAYLSIYKMYTYLRVDGHVDKKAKKEIKLQDNKACLEIRKTMFKWKERFRNE